MLNKKASAIQPKNSKLTLQVMDDLTVQLYTNPKFDFLMDTNTVALGYGVSPSTVKSNKFNHKDELVEGRHWLLAKGVQNMDTLTNEQPHKILWTKAGVIRLGFFIKSERAKAFRDWAEQIVLEVIAPPVNLPVPAKRNHNRLTQERMIGILADVAKDIRLSLIQKLGV